MIAFLKSLLDNFELRHFILKQSLVFPAQNRRPRESRAHDAHRQHARPILLSFFKCSAAIISANLGLSTSFAMPQPESTNGDMDAERLTARGNARLGLIVRGKSPFSEVGVLEFWIDIHASDKRDMTEATQTNPLQQRIPVFHGMWRGSNKAMARGAPRTCS